MSANDHDRLSTRAWVIFVRQAPSRPWGQLE